jgi:acyl-CoA reductase-like NAD-dependent aldehyde dehydrogenase
MTDQRTACYNPATGDLLGYSDVDTPDQAQAAVAAARQGQPAWAALTIAERTRHVRRILDFLVAQADRLAAVISEDNGKTRVDAMATEVLPAAMAVDYYCRKARRFLKDRRLMPASLLLANKNAKLVRVPYGVIGIISPWNYPFGIPFAEVIMALLAGNAVILKTAGATQMVGRALARCIEAAGLPPGIFSFLNLPGPLAGEALLQGGVDKLFFTGSTAVGKALMAQAARNLTPLVLELGGNDPMLVCADADLARAAAGAVWAGLQNCGQSCGGVERIYVHQSVYAAFLEELSRRVGALRIGPDTDFRVDLGAMTTTKQAAEVRRQVDAALAAGAQIHAQAPAPAGAHFLPAMVLTRVDHSMDIMRRETFGPVVGVMAVTDMDRAVELANDTEYGLTASVWSRNARRGEALARRIKAGTVMLNDHLMSHGLHETPWGGFKQSGIGRTHGALGMAEMTQVQCIVHDRLPWARRNFWWHPYGPDIYLGMRGIIDLLYHRRLARRFKGLLRLLRVFPRTFRTK